MPEIMHINPLGKGLIDEIEAILGMTIPDRTRAHIAEMFALHCVSTMQRMSNMQDIIATCQAQLAMQVVKDLRPDRG